MAITHNLGFPRIGKKRELKFALEKYWKRESSQEQLLNTGLLLRQKHWSDQLALDFVPVGDFSFYDQVLDTSFMLGNIPQRAQNVSDNPLDDYFRVARGRASVNEPESSCIHAGEMTKWFDTNYHYIVPEFTKDTVFKLNASRLLEQINEAKDQGLNVKPVIIGPVSYLWLGKSKDDSNKLDLLDDLIPAYDELILELEKENVEWLQIDEPILVLELDDDWQNALRKTYSTLKSKQRSNQGSVKFLLTTYFGKLQENLDLACELAVDGIHLDAINALDEVQKVVDLLADHKVISLGVVNGRNIWKTDLNETLLWLKPLHEKLKERLWLAPSCSLLHVPVDLESEEKIDDEVKSWLSFAIQKLAEVDILARALNEEECTVANELIENSRAIRSRRASKRVHDNAVASRLATIDENMQNRSSSFKQRSEIQQKRFDLPLYPTTTIGSFPQTVEIRQSRRDHKAGTLSDAHYKTAMQGEIKRCIREQETLGLDVLVHGEAERNDMVEYFGEQLTGYAFSQFAWVQSYGSRCVKPPIIYGDISRPTAMTVEWSKYAQSLTEKPMKGMLTGPVTILNWSFVRDDQPRADTCLQLALAIRDEVLDLEASGISMIQIDEAALREGLPLRKAEWQGYLDWAIKAFRITANGVRDETQIHTHMCYSEFNDIIKAIADMDADVITIETSRSDMELLDVFDKFQYPNEIGPGVYDIHSPNIPTVEAMVNLMQKATQRIPAERLWVNPDCGLKTRNWEEVKPALVNMVEASKQLNKLAA